MSSEDLYERQDILGKALMTGFAEMLDLPPETFAQCFEGHDMGTIRLLRYPPAETPEEAARRQVASYGISPHTDFEALKRPKTGLLCRRGTLQFTSGLHIDASKCCRASVLETWWSRLVGCSSQEGRICGETWTTTWLCTFALALVLCSLT